VRAVRACAGGGCVTGRLLNADQLAERLGVPRSWVYAEARSGRLPHVPLGRYKRFRAESVDEWLKTLEQRGSRR
jgi:excisionase family DNA binding protein